MLALMETGTRVHAFRPLHPDSSAAVPIRAVQDLFSKQPLRRLADNEHLFYEEDHNKNVYRIESGMVALYRILGNGRRQIMSLRFPGDVVGLENSGSRHCSAVAIAPVASRAVTQHMVDRLVDRLPQAASEIIDLIGDELDSTWQQITLLNRRSALEKLAAFILELDRRQSGQTSRPGEVLLQMSRTDIADFLGLTIETVSRNLTKLKIRKFIQLPDIHTLVIVDRAGLSGLADGDVDCD
ncbi:helix-turn-helix domain-containing protein [soil metagenome]